MQANTSNMDQSSRILQPRGADAAAANDDLVATTSSGATSMMEIDAARTATTTSSSTPSSSSAGFELLETLAAADDSLLLDFENNDMFADSVLDEVLHGFSDTLFSSLGPYSSFESFRALSSGEASV